MKAADFTVDFGSALPVYAQIRDQILHAIGRGALRPRQQLPTVREIAVHLRVNPNTVNHAYIELERAGVLTTARSRGTFVAEAARQPDAELRTARLRDIARRALGEARAAGFDGRQLTDAITAVAKRK